MAAQPTSNCLLPGSHGERPFLLKASPGHRESTMLPPSYIMDPSSELTQWPLKTISEGFKEETQIIIVKSY